MEIAVDALEAIKKRRSVRNYTDKPLDQKDLDELCRLALLAPTDSMAQAWGLVQVTDPDKRTALADLMVRGGGEYFRTMRPAPEGVSADEHAAQSTEYAEGSIGSMRQAPAWVVGLLVPRNQMPEDVRQMERDANMVSVGFAMENFLVAARSMGLGTVPMVFHRYFEDEFRSLLDIPSDVEVPLVSPVGYPEAFPDQLPPVLQARRRPWKTLVYRDSWNSPIQQP